MKKILAALLVLTVVFSLTACGSQKEMLKEIQSKGEIVIATEGDWTPWTYHDENDTLTGFDIELGTAIAEKLGVNAKFTETNWDSILAGVKSGLFDMACNGVDWTEERAKSYNFSDPYVFTEVVLVVKGDNEDITSIDDLNGKTTANTASSTYAEKAEKKGATVTPVDTLEQTLDLVIDGRVDATINAKGSIEEYLSEHPDADIKIVQTLPGDPVCIPMPASKNSDSLVEAVNKALEEMRADGSLAALSVKYFGVDLTTEN